VSQFRSNEKLKMAEFFAAATVGFGFYSKAAGSHAQDEA
jgi:hypothetical protein